MAEFTTNIVIRGAKFEIVSDRKLSENVLKQVNDSLSDYRENVLKVLSEGTVTEDSVRIVIASKKNWFDLTRSFIYRTAAKFSKPSFWEGTMAMYNQHSNELFVEINDFSAKSKDDLNPNDVNLDRKLKHEFAHAVDDFGAFRLSGVFLTESGTAIETYPESFYCDKKDKIGFIGALLIREYGNIPSDPNNINMRNAERMAASIAFLVDDNAEKLISEFRNTFSVYPEDEPAKNYRKEDPFFKAVISYLQNFPELPPKE